MTLNGLVSRQNLSDIALFVDGSSDVSYGMLHTEIQRLADKIPKGALVFLAGGNDRASVIFYLACLEKGAVPLLLAKDIALGPLQKLMHAYKPNYLFKTPIGDASEEGYSLVWQEGNMDYSIVMYLNSIPFTLIWVYCWLPLGPPARSSWCDSP